MNFVEALTNPTSWGTPLGVGFFLVCLGIFLFLLSKADDGRGKKK